MKKKLYYVPFVAIVLVLAMILSLNPTSSKADVPSITCSGTISGFSFICTNESNSDCSYVGEDHNTHTLCYGKFYMNSDIITSTGNSE